MSGIHWQDLYLGFLEKFRWGGSFLKRKAPTFLFQLGMNLLERPTIHWFKFLHYAKKIIDLQFLRAYCSKEFQT